MTAKPQLSFWQIWNMCFGFLGIQFGFALQNANVSRIFQTLGASVDDIPALWIAAPLTGLIVQPIVGYFSGLHAWNTAFFIGVGFALVSAAAWLGIRVEQAAAPAVPPVPGGAVVGEGAILR